MNVLDLFSGIGGFSLGLERAGMNTVAFCEIDNFCQKVLSKNFPYKPIFADIKKLSARSLLENGINKKIDLVCGGFPCQPFSIAGQKKSTKDDRDLWPEMFRIIVETKPTWVIGENVANFINLAFARTKSDLESVGYTVQPFVIPACAVGAQHRRDRVWIIAHLSSKGLEGHGGTIGTESKHAVSGSTGTQRTTSDAHGSGIWEQSKQRSECDYPRESKCHGQKGFIADTDSNGLSGEADASAQEDHQGKRKGNGRTETTFDFGSWWADQSGMGRAIYGFSERVDKYRSNRIAALGNSIVPQIAEAIGKAIKEFK